MTMPNMTRSACLGAARIAAIITLALFAAAHATSASAQTFPSRQIRMIVPSPPGGGSDILGRLIAQRMSERMDQQIMVENRPGADNIIGIDLVVHSAPDGYTIVIVSTGFTIHPAIRKLPYDPIKSLIPISLIGSAANVIFAAPSLPANNVQELIALAKAKPGAIRFAWGGLSNRFGGELFNTMAGVKMQHVPYKGGGPSLVDVMGGQVEVGFGSLVQTLPYLRSGKLKAIGVGSEKRSPLMPDVPTIAESGLPGYDGSVWWGVLGPAGIPAPIVTRLNFEIGAILKEPEISKRLQALSLDAIVAPPEAFAKLIATDIAKWIRVGKEADIRAE